MLRHLKHQEMVDLLRKYYRKIRTGFAFNLAGNINETKLVNAKKQFAKDLDEKSVLGFYDTSLKNNGWNGYLFTDTKVYYQETGGKPQIIDYDNIKNIKLISKGKKDRDNELRFEMMDGTVKIWKSILLNKTPLFEFFNELLQLDNISYGDEKKSDKDKEKSEDILHDRKQPETLMVKHQEKIDLLRKYYRKIRTGFAFNLAGNINETKLVNAKKKFAKDLDEKSVLGFYDTSLKNNGWNGYLFTDTKVYYQETGSKPQIIDYDNIKNIKLISKGKKDRDNELRFEMMEGTVKIWKSILLNKG